LGVEVGLWSGAAGGRKVASPWKDRAAERDPGQIDEYRGADVVRLQLSNEDFPHEAAGEGFD